MISLEYTYLATSRDRVGIPTCTRNLGIRILSSDPVSVCWMRNCNSMLHVCAQTFLVDLLPTACVLEYCTDGTVNHVYCTDGTSTVLDLVLSLHCSALYYSSTSSTLYYSSS